jgi:hypothetical protein
VYPIEFINNSDILCKICFICMNSCVRYALFKWLGNI